MLVVISVSPQYDVKLHPNSCHSSKTDASPQAPDEVEKVATGVTPDVKTVLQTTVNQADLLCQDMGRVYPAGDARGHRSTLARNGQRLPYHERILVKKLAQWKKKRSGGGQTEVRIGTLNMGIMTGRVYKLVDVMERKQVKIVCLQEAK